jgi:hypothetical protein
MKATLQRRPLASFCTLSFAIAWSVAATVGTDPEALRAEHSPAVAVLLDRIPKFSFTIAALVLVFVGGVDRRAWVRRMRSLPRIRWLVAAWLTPRLDYGLAALLAGGHTAVAIDGGWVRTALFGADTGPLTYIFTRAGLGEEPGLRGFALARLEQRSGRLRGAVRPWAYVTRVEVAGIVLGALKISQALVPIDTTTTAKSSSAIGSPLLVVEVLQFGERSGTVDAALGLAC